MGLCPLFASANISPFRNPAKYFNIFSTLHDVVDSNKVFKFISIDIGECERFHVQSFIIMFNVYLRAYLIWALKSCFI